MALAEARAAWQRTGNRCLVQEDAKRAPKLAYCSSVPPPCSKPSETGPTTSPSPQDIPPTSAASNPFDRNSSYSNLSPNSRWWLHLQPNYPCHKGFTDEIDTSQIKDGNFVTRETKDLTLKEEKFRSFCDVDSQDCYFDEPRDECVVVSCGVSKNTNEHCFYSESSWIGAGEKNSPWWRTADTEELALLVAQKSHDLIENCDLPNPQNTHLKKETSTNISTSLTVRKPGIIAARNSCQKLSMSAEEQSMPGAGKPLRDRAALERMPEMHAKEEDDDDDDDDGVDDASKAQLLQALRYSQTRAREAEEVAKQACAEKEHVVKLVFRQASQLFAYKQWIQLLQLENMYFQSNNNNNNKSHHETVVLLPGKSVRSRKMRKGSNRSKRAKGSRPWYEVGRYAIVFALGLGLVGAGLLLGWTIGWMLPSCW
ncbi:hypothetical protein ACP275_14G141400 [Erythranthe tilingii]